MKWLSPKDWKPIFIEDSRVPGWLSKIAPLNIGAITVFFLVFSKGKINEVTKRHETIHFQQQLELGFVLQWLLYGLFWLFGLVWYRSGSEAYYKNPFELEAYGNDKNENYLEERKRYAWTYYILY